jgi:hypothetical protein
MGKRKTVGDVIRRHLEEFRKRADTLPVGTEEGKKFLELPDENRFNAAGTIYATALEMLSEAVQTVEDLMFQTVIQQTRPIDRKDPDSDAAVIRGWQLLQDYGRLVKLNPNDRCTCHDRRKDHLNGEGSCRKCACTWFHPLESG